MAVVTYKRKRGCGLAPPNSQSHCTPTYVHSAAGQALLHQQLGPLKLIDQRLHARARGRWCIET